MIVVTGGAGFIGSVLIAKLNAHNFNNILIIDKFENQQKWLNLRGLKYSEFLNIDDVNFNTLSQRKIDFIFHMGACSATTETDVDFLMRNNLEFSKKIFNLAIKCQAPIVYASSAATYGDGEQGYSDDHATLSKLLPLNPYGYSKQLFDEWALKQDNISIPWAGIKFFNVFGPHEYHKEEMRSMVNKAYHQIREEKKVKLFKSYKKDCKDGEQLRDFVYVNDVVSILYKLFLHFNDNTTAHSDSGIYNLGTGIERSFKDLMMACFKSLDIKVNIEYIEMPLNIRDQYQYFTKANMDKIDKLFPDFKFMPLEESVDDYIKTYLTQDHPYLRSL